MQSTFTLGTRHIHAVDLQTGNELSSMIVWKHGRIAVDPSVIRLSTQDGTGEFLPIVNGFPAEMTGKIKLDYSKHASQVHSSKSSH